MLSKTMRRGKNKYSNEFYSEYTGCPSTAGGRAQPLLWKNVDLFGRKERDKVRPPNSHFTVIRTTLIEAVVSRRKERRLILCVTLLTKAIFPLSSEPTLWVALVPGLSWPLALCMRAAGIMYYGIWMEKGAEETVQNCNFLDSKISDLTASMLEKKNKFQKRCEIRFNLLVAMALCNGFWNYHSSHKDDYVFLFYFFLNQCA